MTDLSQFMSKRWMLDAKVGGVALGEKRGFVAVAGFVCRCRHRPAFPETHVFRIH